MIEFRRCHPTLPRRAVCAALLAAAPALVAAEPFFQVPLYGNADMDRFVNNNVELGFGYNDVTGASYKFGEWTGLWKSEGFLIANGSYAKRDLATGGFANAWGLNVGLPSRQLGGSIGTQGSWSLGAEFDQFPHAQTNQASFIFNGLGSSFLTLPANYPGISAGTSQPPANPAAVYPFENYGFGVKTDRDVFKLGGGLAFGGDWEFTANYRYDKRDGSRITGAVMGNSGGNPRSVLVPYAIDDNTNQFELALKYAGEKAQFTVSYWYSRYANDNPSFAWQNPYAYITGWQLNSGVGFPTGYGQMALPPDNSFQQIQATGGYNFTSRTRLAATFQYGEAKQNDAFLAQTINVPPLVTPGLAVPYPMPAGSLDGKIKNTLFDVTLTTRDLGKLYVKLNYHYNDNDNTTPQRQYVYTAGDSLNQPVIPAGQTPDQVNANQIRTNAVPGATENRFTIDGDYPIARGTAIRAWYQYLKTDYKVASEELRPNSNVNEFGIELKSRANEVANGYVKYVYDQRRGADFTPNAPYAAAVTAPTLAFNNFDGLPTVRQFLFADYDQSKVKGQLTVTPAEPWSVQAQIDWWKRNYKGPDCGGPNDQLLLNQSPPLVFPAQCQGLQSSTGQSYTLDTQYAAGGGLNWYAFVTWSQIDQDQAGRSFSAVTQGSPTIGQSVDPARNWWSSPKTSDTAVGLGFTWKPEGKPYDGGLQYLYNQGITSTLTSAASGIASPTAIPDIKNTLNSLQIFGKWQYSKNLLFRANYWYQHYKSADWAYDNAIPTSTNNVLLTGQPAPRYTANVFGISLAYTNW